MKNTKKKFEVSLTETNHGHIVVEAENRAEATRIALHNYHKGIITMEDTPNIETNAVKEISPIGFLPHS